MNISLYIRLTIALLLLSCGVYAQQAQVSLSRNQILIGEQIQYKLKVRLQPGTKASFIFPDTIPHFDIIRKSEVKPLPAENAVEQVFIFTSFDSGKWFIPEIPITIIGKTNSKIYTPDSILINVGYSPDDGTGKLRDIKPVRDVEVPDYFWYYFLIAMTLLFLVIFLLVKYFSKKKKKPATPADIYGEAMDALNRLHTTYLDEGSNVKVFHTGLSAVFRRYISHKTGVDETYSTTSDILIMSGERYPDIKTDLAAVLRINDAVKFAKYRPSKEDSLKALDEMKELITSIDKYHLKSS